MTGRGYQFTGRIPLDHPLTARLAGLVPAVPSWFETLDARRPPGVGAPMTPAQARASAGLGLVVEHLSAAVMAEAQPESRIPVVFNGTVVGSGYLGRECTSIDFSYAGDPLDTRAHARALQHLSMASRPARICSARRPAWRFHRWPPSRAGRESLLAMLAARPRPRPGGPARRADPGRRCRTLPRGSDGSWTTTTRVGWRPFTGSTWLRASIRIAARPALDLDAVPPCLAAPLRYPNDLLLKPAHLQHLVRGLIARGWHAADIAKLVRRHYEADARLGHALAAHGRPHACRIRRARLRRPHRDGPGFPGRLQLRVGAGEGHLPAPPVPARSPARSGGPRGQEANMTWQFGLASGASLHRSIFDVLARHSRGWRRRASRSARRRTTSPRRIPPRSTAWPASSATVGPSAVSIHAPFGPSLDLASPDRHIREMAIAAHAMAADALTQLGGDIVVVHPSDLERHGRDVEERLSDCAHSLGVVADYCRDLGVTLAVESPSPSDRRTSRGVPLAAGPARSECPRLPRHRTPGARP